MKRFAILPALAVATLTACGGGEPAQAPSSGSSGGGAAPAEPAVPSGEMTMPQWMLVDNETRTVSMTITAGRTAENNRWNFNGAIKGEILITVPVGYEVTLEFVNDDPVMVHSLGISTETGSFGATVDATPAFPGAMTQNTTSMVDATMPGQRETIVFTPDATGEYTMVCYIPGHAVTGMWVYFNVSADGAGGVQQ